MGRRWSLWVNKAFQNLIKPYSSFIFDFQMFLLHLLEKVTLILFIT